jgi:hypothetical protein
MYFADAIRFRQRGLLSIMVFSILCITCVLAVINGSVYDDEIFSIVQVSQKGVLELIHTMNAGDVHPPGAYVINRLLLDTLHNWSLVKIADGILNSASLAFFFWMAYPTLEPRARLYLGFILATAATLVIWGTSVRWYAYYNPLVATTFAVLLFSEIDRNARSIILCLMSALLFHINYVTFVAAPTFLAIHLIREWQGFRQKPKDLLLLLTAGSVALLVCIPQLIVFFTVHSRTNLPEQGSPLGAIPQILMTIGLGNAVFPIAILPLVMITTLGVGSIFALLRYPLTLLERAALVALLLGAFAMTVTGLGIRPRNSTWILPLAWLIIASFLAKLPRPSRLIIGTLFAAFQFVGVRNAIAHQGTIKGSYNTDFRAAMRKLDQWKAQCPNLFVFNHDVVLTELIHQSGISQSTPFIADDLKQRNFSAAACYAVVKTYHEPFDRQTVDAYYGATQNKPTALVDVADISQDSDYRAKSWLRHENFAPFYLHMELYRVTRATIVPTWKFKGWTQNAGAL